MRMAFKIIQMIHKCLCLLGEILFPQDNKTVELNYAMGERFFFNHVINQTDVSF